MVIDLDEEKIRKLAKALDDTIENRDIDKLVSFFAENCEIQLPGITLNGYEGLRKAIRWMYNYFGEITFIPVTIMIQSNVFFEEFIMRVKIKGKQEMQVKQTEVLIYNSDYKVKSLRLYFDRLELSRAFSSNAVDRLIINKLTKESLKGLQ